MKEASVLTFFTSLLSSLSFCLLFSYNFSFLWPILLSRKYITKFLLYFQRHLTRDLQLSSLNCCPLILYSIEEIDCVTVTEKCVRRSDCELFREPESESEIQNTRRGVVTGELLRQKLAMINSIIYPTFTIYLQN